VDSLTLGRRSSRPLFIGWFGPQGLEDRHRVMILAANLEAGGTIAATIVGTVLSVSSAKR
jgi:hypothetical protein